MIYRVIFILTLLGLSSSNPAYFKLLSTGADYSELKFVSKDDSYTLSTDNSRLTITYGKNNEKVLSASENSFDFYTPLTINSTEITFDDQSVALLHNGVPQWTLVSLDDFQKSSDGWSSNKTSHCGKSENVFLGGHCNFGSLEVKKKFTNLPKHKSLRITANFHFIDMWEGENAYMKFNNKTVWTDSYKWCDKVIQWRCKKYGINACGAEYPDRMSVPIEFIANHKDDSFDLVFGADLDKKPPCEASWGIDDISVYIK